MDNNVVLSICVPTYSRRELVCENVKKMLKYEGDDIEVIVNDNASEDGTVDALREIDDKRLRIYQNEINVGASGNYIRVLMYATGKYVMHVNDRDWIEPQDIQDFVKTYQNSECDFILGINQRRDFKNNVDKVSGRTYLINYYSHPGLWITGKVINKKLTNRIMERETSEYTDDWVSDVGKQRIRLCISAKQWGWHNQLVKQPEPDKLAQIKQLRGKSYYERVYFTPESQLYRFKYWLDNPYIQKKDVGMYAIGCYKSSVHTSLSNFYILRNDPYTRTRNHYEPTASVCWSQIAFNCYIQTVCILKEHGVYTHRLAINIAIITIKEYVWFCAFRIKKKFFPKPWAFLH